MEKIEGSVTLTDAKIQWHPAFCAAIELELSANRAELDFQREYNLSKKPLQIDLLVIKKLNDVEIEDEIGHIFRRYNIIEFKSPDDGMSIDDFFKTVGYACLYKGLGESVDQIPADQLTVSLVREGKPVELFRDLGKYGFSVEEVSDGIYYVKEEMKRRDSRMCEAMRMLMKDEIGEAEREGREAGRETGREEGDIAAIKNMYELGIDVQKICTKYPGALVERALGASVLHTPS